MRKDHRSACLIVRELVDDKDGGAGGKGEQPAILGPRRLCGEALAHCGDADAVPLQKVEIEQLGHVGRALREIRQARGRQKEALMHRRAARDTAQPMDGDQWRAERKTEARGVLLAGRDVAETEDFRRGAELASVGAMQPEILKEISEVVVWRPAGHDGTALAPARQHPLRREIGERMAHGADGDAVVAGERDLAWKLAAWLVSAEQDRLRELALHVLIERQRASDLRSGVGWVHINIIEMYAGPGKLVSAAAKTAPLEKALARIAGGAERALADLARMLECDTSFPPGTGYGAFADLMEPRLAKLGFAVRRVVVPSSLCGEEAERVNLIATRQGDHPVCSLYFHVDTVPPGPGWSVPPLALTRVANRLYGRGSADMKGTIAAALLALDAAAAAGLPLAYEPELLLCTDEEGGLYPGIRHLAEQGLIGGHLLSFNGSAAPRIWAGCFGSFDLLIRVEGKGGHSGDGRGSRNAIELALPLLMQLAALKREVEARRSALPPRPGQEKLAARLTIAAAHGGDKGSAVPALFEILVNRRYAPEEEFSAAYEELEAVIAAASEEAGLPVHTRLLGHLAPVSDPTGPHWLRWQLALAQAFGWRAEEFSAWGASSSSDMGWVQRAGIREILLGGLGRPDNHVHAADEFTTIEDLTALARSILLYLAADFAQDQLPEEPAGRR